MDAQAPHGHERAGRLRLAVLGVVLVALIVVLIVRLWSAQHVVATTPHPAANQTHQVAPNFTLTSWSGQSTSSVQLSALRGKPVVLNFWAPWCEPCQQEAPTLTHVVHEYEPRGVTFLGLTEDATAADTQTFMRQHDLQYVYGPDTGASIAASYGITGIPVTVFVNRQGIITGKIPGAVTQKDFDTQIQAILK